MKAVLAALLVVLAALVQVTVAPLFPLRGAVADAGLVTLLALAAAMGPRVALWAVPLFALTLSWVTDRSPGLLLLAYLPLLPLAYFLEGVRLPMGRLSRALAAGAATGLWARGLLAGGAMAQGASFALSQLVTTVLVPGLAFDLVLVAGLYLFLRLAGREPRSLSLARTGW